MKAKIYYAPDLSVSWHTIGWIDLDGQMHNDVLQVGYDHPNCPADVCREFELLHPGAARVSRKKLNDLFRKIVVERLKLAAWREWTV